MPESMFPYSVTKQTSENVVDTLFKYSSCSSLCQLFHFIWFYVFMYLYSRLIRLLEVTQMLRPEEE